MTNLIDTGTTQSIIGEYFTPVTAVNARDPTRNLTSKLSNLKRHDDRQAEIETGTGTEEPHSQAVKGDYS